jgi:hypothetical protein
VLERLASQGYSETIRIAIQAVAPGVGASTVLWRGRFENRFSHYHWNCFGDPPPPALALDEWGSSDFQAATSGELSPFAAPLTPDESAGELAGTVSFDPACIADLVINDPEFAELYAGVTAFQDPEDIPVVILYRTTCKDSCTLGELWVNGTRLCYTLELPDLNNAQNKSCIPLGEYICAPYSSKKFPDVYEVTDVEGRSKILIHLGNDSSDTHGCILVGLTVDEAANSIGQSRRAMAALRAAMRKCKFKLTIKKGPSPTPTPKPTRAPRQKNQRSIL